MVALLAGDGSTRTPLLVATPNPVNVLPPAHAMYIGIWGLVARVGSAHPTPHGEAVLCLLFLVYILNFAILFLFLAVIRVW